MTEIVTVRVKKSLKEKTRKYNINVSKTVRAALEAEIKKHEQEELSQALNDIKTILQKIPDEEIVKAIRESRDQR
ncbi:MAG: type II toxin-antitoxin system CcdA family antitoxin [Candidatus Bathyarchaeia archaeon]|jgi:post-segregation antitoxin (ccd killing protein)